MSRRLVLALLAALALALAGCSRSSVPAAASGEIKALTVDEVAARIAAKDGKTFVFDANPPERYKKSHLPGAKWVESGEISAQDLPADKAATLVFYCANEH